MLCTQKHCLNLLNPQQTFHSILTLFSRQHMKLLTINMYYKELFKISVIEVDESTSEVCCEHIKCKHWGSNGLITSWKCLWFYYLTDIPILIYWRQTTQYKHPHSLHPPWWSHAGCAPPPGTCVPGLPWFPAPRCPSATSPGWQTLPPSTSGINFFCRGRWNRKLELSQKVMNTPYATWERELIFLMVVNDIELGKSYNV